MEKYKHISRQVFYSYAAMIIIFLFNPLLIFLLTRNLSISHYGVYSLFSSTRIVAAVILELGLVQFIITKISGEKRRNKIISFFSINVFELIFLIFVLGLFLLPIIQEPILSLLKIQNFSLHFNILLLIIFVSVFIRLYTGYLSANKKLEFVSLVNVLKQCLWILFLALIFLIFKGFTLRTVLIMWLIGLSISLISQILYLRKDVLNSIKMGIFDYKILKKGLIFGWPLIPAILGSWIIALGDRYMLAYFMDTTAVGIYTLAYSLVTIILTSSAVIVTILYPYIAEAWNKKKNHLLLFNISLKYVLLIVIPSIVGLFIMQKQIVTLISGENYLSATPIISLLLFYPLLALLIELFYKNLLLRNKTKIIGSIYLSGAVLNVMLNIWLIPKIEIRGAAIATLVTYFVMFMIMVFISKGHFKWDYRYLSVGRILVASIIMGIIVYVINPQIALTKILTIILAIIIYVLLLFVFKVFIKKEIDLLKDLIKRNFPIIKTLIK